MIETYGREGTEADLGMARVEMTGDSRIILQALPVLDRIDVQLDNSQQVPCIEQAAKKAQLLTRKAHDRFFSEKENTSATLHLALNKLNAAKEDVKELKAKRATVTGGKSSCGRRRTNTAINMDESELQQCYPKGK
eukprot:14208216-Ditylum_brightwellii.AAC.1